MGNDSDRLNGLLADSPAAPAQPAWPAATATALGPMPGRDIDETLRAVVGELPELPFLPQLPARGVGADLAGRAIAMLVDIWADVVPSGWRVSRRPSRDGQRGRDFLARDLDALQVHARGVGALKLQVCGPWTLGALLEVPAGHRVITDPGAIRDLTASLAEGLAGHLADCRARLPGTQFFVQIDESLLPAVLAGSLPTASGLTMVRPMDAAVVREQLSTVLSAVPGVRSIANAGRNQVPYELLRAVGFDAIRVDFAGLGRTAAELDPIGESLSSGTVLLAGVIPIREPATADGKPDLAGWANPITEPLRALGFSAATIADQIIPTPAGALDAAPFEWATEALRLSRDVGRLLAEGSDGSARLLSR